MDTAAEVFNCLCGVFSSQIVSCDSVTMYTCRTLFFNLHFSCDFFSYSSVYIFFFFNTNASTPLLVLLVSTWTVQQFLLLSASVLYQQMELQSQDKLFKCVSVYCLWVWGMILSWYSQLCMPGNKLSYFREMCLVLMASWKMFINMATILNCITRLKKSGWIIKARFK